MKTVSPALLAHLSSETTTTATLWKLVRRDAVTMGFTDHDTDIAFDGLTYRAETGYTRTALVSDATLSVDNMDIEGLLATGALTADDIRNGVYDWAELTVYIVNYSDLTQGAVILRRGFLGEFTLRNGVFVTELRGISQALSRNFIRVYTADCTADLGDSRCRVDMSLHRETGTVSAVTSQRHSFTVSLTGSRPDEYFNGGLLVWTSGLNTGARQEVRTLTGNAATLYLPSAEDIAVGDAFTIEAGCDKTITMCKNRYNNIVNNRSFPFIPGADKVNRVPDAKPS
jgi:uncharacterized phage protein (TIGR02218 family)